ncbi:MAG: endonuclease III [Candidatus Marsarchaeota archaeon]|nr:endonuclease III [Candidatus Marsarchaeota archaeon]
MQAKLLESNKINKIVDMLFELYPNAKYYLNFNTPIELVVASILSAQTRDETVNKLTAELFSRYKDCDAFSNATKEDLLKYIKSVSFADKKAENIIKTCKEIKSHYNGVVPNNMDKLLMLPGIGRKTANTILINAYGIVEGIPVDTWVIKLSNRIGLSQSNNADIIEADLKFKVDKKYWKNLAYVLKSHGKAICGNTPKCNSCNVNKLCMKNGV